MHEERSQWLSAVEEFRNNINAVIKCPSCREGILFCTDIAFDDTDVNKGGERIIECEKCKKFEALLYRNPPGNWYSKNKQ